MTGLEGLIVLALVLGAIFSIAYLLINKMPIDATFKQIAILLLILLAIIIFVTRAWPILNGLM